MEDRLEALGAALRARPGLGDRVMEELRKSAADGPVAEPAAVSPVAARRRRRLLGAAVAAAAAISVAVLLAPALFPSRSVSWADVARTMQSQEWIRATATHQDGERATIWLSPKRQIWAFRLEKQGEFRFLDGRERAKYEYSRFGKRITRLPLGEEEAERSSFFEGLSQGETRLPSWLFGEKIVGQKRRQVTEGGKTWIEFQLVLWHGPNNQATLRVDPKTELPVSMRFTSRGNAGKSFTWKFDYPPDGPADIYALGVPRDVKIDERMPSNEARRVLDAMAAGRARLGDFRLMVAEEGRDRTFIVWRKGDRWRVDLCEGTGGSLPAALAKPATGQSVSDWFTQRLKRSRQVPLYVCDGKTVYRNMASGRRDAAAAQWRSGRDPAPQDLMSNDGWIRGDLPSAPYVRLATLVYPDLTPDRGTPFELDPRPAGFPGCVLIKKSALLTDGSMAHEWCYVDSAKGYAIVRAEVFSLPPNAPARPEASADCQTFRMEGFQRSPRGFWYPTVVHDAVPARPGRTRQAKGPIRQVTTTVRYQLDSDADLPDSLFRVRAPMGSELD